MTTARGRQPRSADMRRGPRPRNRALCCECGTLRWVAETYYGAKPQGSVHPERGHYLNWVKCSTCRQVTLHAMLQDAARTRPSWNESEGCAAEQNNRAQTAAQAELARLLARCEDLQITVEWVEELPHWEKRFQNTLNPDVIVAEVDSLHHVRMVTGTPATKVVGALRRIITGADRDEYAESKLYPICGCGWDIYVCSYCPGESWRWKG